MEQNEYDDAVLMKKFFKQIYKDMPRLPKYKKGIMNMEWDKNKNIKLTINYKIKKVNNYEHDKRRVI